LLAPTTNAGLIFIGLRFIWCKDFNDGQTDVIGAGIAFEKVLDRMRAGEVLLSADSGRLVSQDAVSSRSSSKIH
jgi:hypothetical protein